MQRIVLHIALCSIAPGRHGRVDQAFWLQDDPAHDVHGGRKCTSYQNAKHNLTSTATCTKESAEMSKSIRAFIMHYKRVQCTIPVDSVSLPENPETAGKVKI